MASGRSGVPGRYPFRFLTGLGIVHAPMYRGTRTHENLLICCGSTGSP